MVQENEPERAPARPQTHGQKVAGTIKLLAIAAALMALLWLLDSWVS
ncbi:MAG TPA: hypothetical protein VHA11_09440 [Bryobacteraceae bacterium]|nr:hypothetical protein [Bryobacteraceae bacterium]